MKTNFRTMAPCFAVLCLGLTPAARAGDPASDPLPYHDQEMRAAACCTEGKPACYNRASGIIGMDVRNEADQYLGRIKDVVFDLNTERVAYAVISAHSGGFLSLATKLLAVPVNTLKASADGHHLVLNADKAQLAAATGFDRNNWPSVNNPTWGAQPFWEKKPSEAEPGEPSAEEPMGVDNPDTDWPAPPPEPQSSRAQPAPNVSSALDRSPGGLAWPGF